MAYAELNGERIISGSISIPLYGLWVADVLLALTEAVPTQCTLTIGDLTLVGFSYRTAGFAGSRSVRLVGGFGGWHQQVTARAYENPAGVPLSMVLSDAAIEVGEKVNVQQDGSVGLFYIRQAGPAQEVLGQLANPLWWVDSNGVTQVGPRDTSTITSDFQVESYSGGKGKFTISTEHPKDWQPGRVFSNFTVTEPKTIGLVRHSIQNDGKSRLEVLST